jgi:hypothetical protein
MFFLLRTSDLQLELLGHLITVAIPRPGPGPCPGAAHISAHQTRAAPGPRPHAKQPTPAVPWRPRRPAALAGPLYSTHVQVVIYSAFLGLPRPSAIKISEPSKSQFTKFPVLRRACRNQLTAYSSREASGVLTKYLMCVFELGALPNHLSDSSSALSSRSR